MSKAKHWNYIMSAISLLGMFCVFMISKDTVIGASTTLIVALFMIFAAVLLVNITQILE